MFRKFKTFFSLFKSENKRYNNNYIYVNPNKYYRNLIRKLEAELMNVYFGIIFIYLIMYLRVFLLFCEKIIEVF